MIIIVTDPGDEVESIINEL